MILNHCGMSVSEVYPCMYQTRSTHSLSQSLTHFKHFTQTMEESSFSSLPQGQLLEGRYLYCDTWRYELAFCNSFCNILQTISSIVERFYKTKLRRWPRDLYFIDKTMC